MKIKTFLAYTEYVHKFFLECYLQFKFTHSIICRIIFSLGIILKNASAELLLRFNFDSHFTINVSSKDTYNDDAR